MQKLAYFFISAIAIVVTLIYGSNLLIPFVFAILLWFIIRKIKQQFDRVGFVRKKVPSWLKSVAATMIILLVLSVISKIISTSINTLATSHGGYNTDLDQMFDQLPDLFGLSVKDSLKDIFADLNIGKMLGSVFNSLSGILGSTFMIILYALFIYMEQTYFLQKIQKVVDGHTQFEQFNEVIERIERSIEKYLWLKSLMSLTTGTLSYFILLAIGIDAPVFWAFLIFLLNYIPTVGSMVATLFPTAYCIIQFGGFHEAGLVLVLIASVQVLVGNIMEPRLMGNSMNLSPLVTILSLSFWGAIWGVTGMFLCIPITVIFMIIMSQFPKTRPIAIFLSQKGSIEEAAHGLAKE